MTVVAPAEQSGRDQKLYLGAFKGSDFPDKIAHFGNGSEQIIWKKPGATVQFDSMDLLTDPVQSDITDAVVYRIKNSDGSSQAVAYRESSIIVFDTVNGQRMPNRAYRRYHPTEGKGYEPPKSVILGQPSPIFGGAIVTHVNVISSTPLHNDGGITIGEAILHGCRGMVGDEYSGVPRESIGQEDQAIRAALDSAEAKLNKDASAAGKIAAFGSGVQLY